MHSKLIIVGELPNFLSPLRQLPCLQLCRRIPCASRTFQFSNDGSLRFRRCFSAAASAASHSSTLTSNSTPSRNGVYTVGDFMTKKEDLVVVKPSTTVDEALETLVEYRITGFPVINDDWELVGVVSDYDLLALDSISGTGVAEASMFPEVDSTWKVFNELQSLLSKTNGKLVSDVMTQVPVAVRETTNLEDAARLLLETRYRRLPVVDADGKLVGIITRGNVVRAALQIKRESEKKGQ
ncbi:CBS domain-containing protein CBSX1, chloroplastic-like [Chenopodium quinoa]|uniref:CBS domain-containing protein n=1 Tax=Chenopodium quinoa TaxID=63459 RepID=A0A803KY03_CHEQI|nr:CBS domain-containing protein CBSX1, chloroplastic-like [Chenopodium quinoa]